MTDALRLRFEACEDGTGQLFATVNVGDFAGSSTAWFTPARVLEFAGSVANSYPFPSDEPFRLEGGTGHRSSTGEVVLDEIWLGLSVYPIDKFGHVGIKVVLSEYLYEQGRPESRSSVATELQTDYETVQAFARSLHRLISGSLDEAVLVAGA